MALDRVKRLASKRAHYYRHNAALREKAREYQRRPENRGRLLAHRALANAFIDAAKAGGCVDCGHMNLSVLQLDHVRGEKVVAVTMLVDGALEVLFAEIDKCETRCANCHKLATDRRRKKAA